MKKALITGITGQDGSYLTEFLLSLGYEVHGLIRRSSTFNTGRLEHIYIDPHEPKARLFLHYGDLSDSSQLTNLIYNAQPDDIYHLAAQSHVRVSFDMPEYSGDITGLGTIRILESIRRSGIKCRFYQASSSEMFVTRKITRGIAMILAEKQKYLFLGNLEPKRDWGFAPEYVEMMWKMLQQDEPRDYIIGTGESHSVQDFKREVSKQLVGWRLALS